MTCRLAVLERLAIPGGQRNGQHVGQQLEGRADYRPILGVGVGRFVGQ